jgi:small-conductance mechanosensitive channel
VSAVRYVAGMRRIASAWFLLLVVSVCPGILVGQDPGAGQAGGSRPEQQQDGSQEGPQQGAALDQDTRDALANLAEQLVKDRAALAQARSEGKTDEVKRLTTVIEDAEAEFAKLTARVDVKHYQGGTKAKFDLQQEIEEILRPLMRLLSDATEGPRELAELRAELERVTAKKRIAEKAKANVLRVRDALAPDSPARAEAERELEERWDPELKRLGSEMLVLNASITQLEEGRESIWETVGDNTRDFVGGEGLNLVICVAVFTLTWLLVGFLGRRLLKLRPRGSFSRRLGEVLLRLVAGVTAMVTTLAVIYARDDMLLLAIAFVVLIGFGWVVIKAAPQFLDQIRLVLNVGAVREGERILIDGLPYRVESLRFFSWLKNPLLQGGNLRMPLKDLLDKRSRPLAKDEPWFPCAQGDVVALSDGTIGVVHLQTPEVVTISMRGQPQQHIPTLDFLEMKPRSLSDGFEIRVIFGVDYGHQQDVLTAVPSKLADAIQQRIAEDESSQHLKAVKVEFNSAGSSSLDMIALVAFEGEAALRYYPLMRRINQALVAACNEHGFGIPFPQLTVHGIGERGMEE